LVEAGVRIVSEQRQRQLSKKLVALDIKAEAVPFTFALKAGGKEVRPCGMTHIPSLLNKVIEFWSTMLG